MGFYKNKVAEIGGNLGDLEKIVKGKQGGLGVVEDGEFFGGDMGGDNRGWG